MYPKIKVVQRSKNKLVEREYNFILLDNLEFKLNNYVLRKKQSPRHGFRMTEVYNRIRVNTTYYGVLEHLQEPPIPKSVVRAFYRKVRTQITLAGYPDE